jgi:exosortase/archaeosortase
MFRLIKYIILSTQKKFIKIENIKTINTSVPVIPVISKFRTFLEANNYGKKWSGNYQINHMVVY